MSKQLYTDQELCWATQVAYCNLDKNKIDEHYKINQDYPTLQQLFTENGYGIYYDQDLITGQKREDGPDFPRMEESAKEFIDAVIAGEICQGWKVVSVRDEQWQNGLYGLTIETASDSAIVAFRGSESVDIHHKIEDWLVADAGIINGELTEQEQVATNYLDEVGSDFTQYQNIAVTGHSLGGNLALMSTMMSASDKIEHASDISTRIKQAVSFDGPGRTRGFLETYADEINAMSGVMKHKEYTQAA